MEQSAPTTKDTAMSAGVRPSIGTAATPVAAEWGACTAHPATSQALANSAAARLSIVNVQWRREGWIMRHSAARS